MRDHFDMRDHLRTIVLSAYYMELITDIFYPLSITKNLFEISDREKTLKNLSDAF